MAGFVASGDDSPTCNLGAADGLDAPTRCKKQAMREWLTAERKRQNRGKPTPRTPRPAGRSLLRRAKTDKSRIAIRSLPRNRRLRCGSRGDEGRSRVVAAWRCLDRRRKTSRRRSVSCCWTPGSAAACPPATSRPWSASPSTPSMPGSASSRKRDRPVLSNGRAAGRREARCPT